MKTVGIIAEYNPFHNGHAYQILEAKKITGADYAVIVMSGDFVQRGAPAIFDKYARTQAALSGGADLVFELPVVYACSSAEYFAEGAVALLDSLHVDALCFGSECGDMDALLQIAELLLNETPLFKQILDASLRSGKTYPAAREAAFASVCSSAYGSAVSERLCSLLNEPNNLLGIEYCKALLRRKSSITPFTVLRDDRGYHSSCISDPSAEPLLNYENSSITIYHSSATALRLILENPDYTVEKKHECLSLQVPFDVLPIYTELLQHSTWLGEDDFSPLLDYCLLTETTESLCSYQDITKELARRMLCYSGNGLLFSELAVSMKSRQLTLTRVNRLLIHALLHIKKELSLAARSEGSVHYARLLGLRENASPCLKKLSSSSIVPIINRLAPSSKLLTGTAGALLSLDVQSAELYRAVLFRKSGFLPVGEYQRGIIRI